MPLTPFHIVAGASVKSMFPRYFSWSVFTLTNILIDTEVLYYLITTGEFSHKFFHTILGASLIAIICATLCKPVCELGLIGAFTAAYTHLILDSVMHADIAPLSPFTNINNILGIITIENLQYICLGSFIFGLIIYLVRKYI